MDGQRILCAAVSLFALYAGAVSAAEGDRIDLDETVISGNQELPKVLYIMPWQDASSNPQIELESGFDELDVFRRLYPPAYRREMRYLDALEAGHSGAAQPPPDE